MRATRSGFGILVLLMGIAPGVRAQDGVGAPRLLSSSDFLYQDGPVYRDYSFSDYVLPDSTRFSRVNYYGPMGNLLMKGYDLYIWQERRSNVASTEPGSVRDFPLPSERRSRFNIFDRNVVVKESHKGWAAGLIMGSEIRTEFTPLTLRLAGFDGVRLDAETTYTRFTTIAERWRGPQEGDQYGLAGGYRDIAAPYWRVEDLRDAAMLLGGHGEVDIGAATLGFTGVNYHLFDADQSEFNMRGGLQSGQVLPSFLVVRIADDSPSDERNGAVVNEVRLNLDGEPRPDLRPFTVRIDSRNPTAVGLTTRTGFRRTTYDDRGTKFADVFYLQRHLAGEDVARSTSLEELLRWVVPVPPSQQQLRANGHDVLLLFYDLRNEPHVRGAQVEALVGSDYRVEAIGIYQADERTKNEELRWSTGGGKITRPIFGGDNSVTNLPGVEARARASGNVQDQSNMEWIRLDVGAFTGRALWGVDGSWQAGNAKVRWEYARSVEYREYPDGQSGFRGSGETRSVRPWNGNRSSTSAAAYYLTAQWRHGMVEGGGELFSIEEEFDGSFVQDNDDNDRYPDLGPGHRPVISLLHVTQDPDGVFPGKDEDNDGIPDTNRNNNELPDYLEPFLRFDVEPDEFVYGRDWNNNGIVDEREDDSLPDFPYEVDQRGTHFYGRLYLPYGLGLASGRLHARGIASGARNESLYGRVSLEYENPDWGHVRTETLVQRLHDDIENPYQIFAELLTGDVQFPRYARTVNADNRLWRNSVDRQHYLETEWRVAGDLRLWGNVRYELNRQRGGQLSDGSHQPPDRLRLLTMVAKSQYVWELNRQWQVTGQYKGLVYRSTRESLPVDLVNEWTLMPMFKVRYRLTDRTQIRFGTEGLPGLPLRVQDRADGRNSLEEETRVLQLTNRSPYYGYEIATTMGVRTRSRRYDDPLRAAENVDTTTIFMKLILGFDENE